MNRKTAIVIPAYNEGKNIGKTVQRTIKTISNHKLNAKIIVVNDGSSDNTAKVAKEKKSNYILSHKVNLGKGGAAKTGCQFAMKKQFDQIILMDADGQHEPEEIPKFLKELKKVDIVYGYRTSEGRSPFLMRFGNFVMTKLTKILFESNIIDTQSGFRALSKKAYRQVKWESNSYGMETEMIVKAKGLKYKQIPIKTIYLEDYKGTTPMDGIKILNQMIKWKLVQIFNFRKN